MRAITEEIEKIREVRKRISASFGHDPKKIVAYYERLVPLAKTPRQSKKAKSASGTNQGRRIPGKLLPQA